MVKRSENQYRDLVLSKTDFARKLSELLFQSLHIMYFYRILTRIAQLLGNDLLLLLQITISLLPFEYLGEYGLDIIFGVLNSLLALLQLFDVCDHLFYIQTVFYLHQLQEIHWLTIVERIHGGKAMEGLLIS